VFSWGQVLARCCEFHLIEILSMLQVTSTDRGTAVPAFSLEGISGLRFTADCGDVGAGCEIQNSVTQKRNGADYPEGPSHLLRRGTNENKRDSKKGAGPTPNALQ
jgi:hypothetical protein